MENVFLLEIVENDILVGASKQMLFFQTNKKKSARKNGSLPPMSRIGPVSDNSNISKMCPIKKKLIDSKLKVCLSSDIILTLD